MGGLELLNPKGLWLLTALAPLVALYILKIRRQRVKVGSTLLWAAAQRDLLAKKPFRRLVAELPLLLQILALVLFSLALARPSLRGARIDGDHVAIVIDTSASMAAHTKDGSTRIAEAKRVAGDAVARLSPGADAIVIEAAKGASVASPLQRDARALRAAIDALDAREVEGDLAPAVALAADRLRSLGGSRRILVVTDGALAKGDPLAASGVDVDVVKVGDDEDNAAIVRVDVRSGLDPASKHEQVQVFAMVKSWAAAPRDAFVTLALDGDASPLASRRLLLPPNEKVPVVLTFEPRAEDHEKGLVVQLAPGDALPLDDVAYGRVPEGLKMPVVLASNASYSWVARALDADPDLDIQRLTIDQLGRVNVDPEALTVVEGACPEKIPGRDVLVVAPPQGTCLGIDVAAPVDSPQLTSWETGDPRFRFLGLDGVHVARATPLGVQGGTASLVRTTNATIVADATTPGRTATIVGFDVGDSDWPLKASFVLFVRNVVELARLHRAQGIAGPARTGEALRLAVPAGAKTIEVSGPGMPARPLPSRGGFAIVPEVPRAGFYRVKWMEPLMGEELVAANLTSEAESDVRPRDVSVAAGGGAAAAGEAKPEAKTLEGSQNEWSAWLALAAALAIAFDVFWITRKPKPARLVRTQEAP